MKIYKVKSSMLQLFCTLCMWFLSGAVSIYATSDTPSIFKILNLAQKYSQSNKDSASFYLDKAFNYSISTLNNNELYEVYISFGKLFSRTGNYPIALKYYFKAVNLLDEESSRDKDNIEIQDKYIKLFTQIAFCLDAISFEKSLYYLKKCLAVGEAIYKKNPSYDINSTRSYVNNDIGTVFLNNNKLDSAEYYYRKSQFYALGNADKSVNARLYNNLGIISLEKGLKKRALSYFNKALLLQQELKDTIRMANAYLNLGEFNYQQKNYDESADFFNTALQYGQKMQIPLIEFKSLKLLAKVYEAKQNFKEAYKFQKQADIMKDSLNGVDKVHSSISIEMQYQFEKQEKLQTSMVQEQKQKSFIYLFIAILLAVLLFIALLLYRNQRILNQKKQIEQNNLELKNENLNLRNHQLQQNLEYKDKEFNMHTQYLLKKNELISSIIQQVSNSQKANESLDNVLLNIKDNIETMMWNELEVLLQSLHSDFYEKLYAQHPLLSSGEKRLCLLIRLNLSTKEISGITMMQAKSVEIARSRLRSKLGLKREDNLMSYLQQF